MNGGNRAHNFRNCLPFRSTWVVSGVRVAQSLILDVILCRSSFDLFPLTIVLSVILRITSSGYHYGICKPFCRWYVPILKNYMQIYHTIATTIIMIIMSNDVLLSMYILSKFTYLVYVSKFIYFIHIYVSKFKILILFQLSNKLRWNFKMVRDHKW
jgi:hypothetical protein